MKLVVFSPKGGVGKSSISNGIFQDLNLQYITNDISMITKIHENATHYKGKIPLEDNTLYDLGGFIDTHISELILAADRIIIPTINDYNSLLRTFELLDFLKQHNKLSKVIIVANMIDTNYDYQEITKPIFERYDVLAYPLKRSKIFKNSMEHGIGVTEAYKQTNLTKHTYKSVYAQYNQILKEIKNGKN